jgi:hypothetical protein
MLKKIMLVVMLTSFSTLFISWGVVGHRAIGEIAANRLGSKARASVKEILGTESLAMVSTYPDEIRPYSQFSYTAPWHYVNMPVGLSYEEFSKQLVALDKPNIYKAILNCIADLKSSSKSKAEKVFAMKFLVHLIGDIHQPMHTGHSEDSGGNAIKVKLMRKETNLHGLWDSGLIDYAGLTYKELAAVCGDLQKKDVKAWQNEDVIKWAFESYQITEQLYAEAAKKPEFDYDYYPQHADLMKKRIAQAGIRLAYVLNNIYK